MSTSAGRPRLASDTAWADAAGLRSRALDGFRGLAVLVMLLDHLCLVFDGPDVLRETVGRLAVPAFFVLAGHLARSPKPRHLYVGCLGIWLTFLIPWLTAPNVLTVWAVGVVLIWGLRRLGVPVLLLAVLGFTMYANGYGFGFAGYEPWALWGLMALGTVIPRDAFGWAGRSPAWVCSIGRHPVAWYAGHLLVLQLVAGVI